MSNATNNPELSFATLRDIGIETQLDGKLSVVDGGSELSTVLAEDFPQLGQFFASPDGFGVRMFDLVEVYIDNDGIIETRSTGLNEKIEGIGDDRQALFERLVIFEARLLRQFNALDTLIGQLTNVSNFLTSQLANLPSVSASID